MRLFNLPIKDFGLSDFLTSSLPLRMILIELGVSFVDADAGVLSLLL